MSAETPLNHDEIAFAIRLLYETLHFDDPIVKSAELKFQKLGLSNGAIENFLRVMNRSRTEYRSLMYDGPEPATVERCPWESQAMFLTRTAELCDWLDQHGGEPADIRCFILAGAAQ